MQVSLLFHSMAHSKQRVVMATPEDNETCDHVQNEPQMLKIKLEKFHLISNGVMELLRKVSRREGVEFAPQVR